MKLNQTTISHGRSWVILPLFCDRKSQYKNRYQSWRQCLNNKTDDDDNNNTSHYAIILPNNHYCIKKESYSCANNEGIWGAGHIVWLIMSSPVLAPVTITVLPSRRFLLLHTPVVNFKYNFQPVDQNFHSQQWIYILASPILFLCFLCYWSIILWVTGKSYQFPSSVCSSLFPMTCNNMWQIIMLM